MNQIVLFGDSLTQFSGDQSGGFAFKAALEDAYIRRLDVVNRGYRSLIISGLSLALSSIFSTFNSIITLRLTHGSGYNTTLALRILPHIIPAPLPSSRIRLLALFLGANDARLPDTPPASQSVSPTQYATNLRSILNHPSVKAHAPHFLLITPPPIDERLCELTDSQKGFNMTRRTVGHTATYARLVRELGAERHIPVLDLWTAFMTRAGWKEGMPESEWPGAKSAAVNETLRGLLKDGLHFTADAYRILYDELMRTIREQLPDLAPERLEMVFPAWNEEEVWETWDGPNRR